MASPSTRVPFARYYHNEYQSPIPVGRFVMWSLPQQPTFINKFCTRGLFYSPFSPSILFVPLFLCCSPCWCSCFFLFLLSLQLEHTAIMHKTQEGTHSSYLYTRTMHNFVVCATSSLALQNRNYACLCLDRLRRVPAYLSPPSPHLPIITRAVP